MRRIGFAATENRTRCAVALIVLALASNGVASKTLAFNEPDGFRGVLWGATEAQLKDQLKITDFGCSDYPPGQQWLGERRCSGGWRRGDLYLELTYSFRRDQLVSVDFSFKSSDFERIESLFVELYGSPTSDITRPFRTQYGREVPDRILNWLGPVISINLFRYIRGTTHGFAIIQTRAEREESEELRRRIHEFVCDWASYWDSAKGECVKFSP